MESYAHDVDPSEATNFGKEAQMEMIKLVGLEKTTSFTHFYFDRQKYVVQKMKSFLEGPDVGKPVPEDITNFLHWVDGTDPEGKPRKEQG